MFYDIFVRLCAEKGKAPSAVAVELGYSKSMVSGWKVRGTSPTDTNLHRIADYFGVSVDYLRGLESLQDVTISGTADPQAAVRQGLIPAGTGIKNAAPKTEREILEERVMVAIKNKSDEDVVALLRLIEK